MKKKILVLGGTGFLGSTFCKKALNKNFKVYSVSTKLRNLKINRKIKYIRCDVSTKNEIEKKLNINFDYVVNFSGYVDHTNKSKTYKSHYIGCKNLVNFFKSKKIKKFVQIGSSLEYGNLKSPHREDLKNVDPSKLKSTYAKSKLLATNYCLKIFNQTQFPVTIIRPYLIYGPGQKTNRLIPFIISECSKDKDFPCSSGNQLRNFLYIDDFISFLFKVLKNDKINGEVFNIGSEENHTVKEVIEKIQKIMKKGHPLFGKIRLRKDESIKHIPNMSKVKQVIKWKPLINIDRGINQTIKFFLRHNN